MSLLNRLFGGNRLYQALAHAYDAALIDRSMRSCSPERFARCGEHAQVDPFVFISHAHELREIGLIDQRS
jgi:hypothetical protein